MVGEAVKVTLLPEHIEVEEAFTLTLATTFAFTVMVTELEVAGLPEMQEAFDVMIQLTTSLLLSDPVL